jgi:transposase
MKRRRYELTDGEWLIIGPLLPNRPRGERWSRFAGQFGGLAKVDSGFDYAANFSSFACLA